MEEKKVIAYIPTIKGPVGVPMVTTDESRYIKHYELFDEESDTIVTIEDSVLFIYEGSCGLCGGSVTLEKEDEKTFHLPKTIVYLANGLYRVTTIPEEGGEFILDLIGSEELEEVIRELVVLNMASAIVNKFKEFGDEL